MTRVRFWLERDAADSTDDLEGIETVEVDEVVEIVEAVDTAGVVNRLSLVLSFLPST